MRRLRQALKRDYTLKKAASAKDMEGNTYSTFGNAIAIKAIIRYVSRILDSAEYGRQIVSVLKMECEDDQDISEGDGICVFVDANSEPDYIVTSIKGLTEDAFKVYTLEVRS